MQPSLDDSVSFETLRPYFEKRENRLYAAKQSFKWFIYLYLSHYLTLKPAPFQLDSYKRAKLPRVLEIWPRTYGKSVTWSIAYPLWVTLNNPYNLDLKWRIEDIIQISNTADLAEKWIRFQKRELMHNPRIKADYDVSEGEVWRVDEIEIKRGGRTVGRISAKGSGAQIRGQHPSELLLDDLENRQDASVEGQREKMREYFYQDLWGTLRHNKNDNPTRIKIVGTIVHPYALLPELYEKDWWTKAKYAVYKPDGKPLWPEYMDDEGLRELRSQITETAWMSEYMNAPIVSENPTFLREWFNGYEPGTIRDSIGKKVSTRDMMIVTAFDPAISQKDSGDYSASATYGCTFDEKDPRIYCLEAKRGHWTMSKQVTELMASYEKYPGSVQLIETVAYQKALYYEYKEAVDRERLNIKIMEVIPDKDKGRRAHGVQPMFQKNMIYFDYSDKMQRLLMDELALFDYSTRKHGRDDWVDATTMCLDYLGTWLRRRRIGVKNRKTPNIVGFNPKCNPVFGGLNG